MRELVYAADLEPGDVLDAMYVDDERTAHQTARVVEVERRNDVMWIRFYYTQRDGRPFYALPETRFVRIVR